MRKLIILLSGFISLSGCSAFYGIADFSTETVVLQKPVYQDSTTSASYLTGTFCNTLNSLVNTNNGLPYHNIQLATASIHTAVNLGKSYYAIGGFGNIGNYEAVYHQDLGGGNNSFFGGGATAEYGMIIKNESVEWRAIGIKATFITELGEYANLRKSAEELSRVNLNPYNTGVNIGLTSEMIYKMDGYNIGVSSALGVGNQIITFGTKAYVEKDNLTLFSLYSTSLVQGNYFGSGVSLNIKKAKTK